MNVADAGAALVVGGGVGLVDVPDFQGLGVQDLAVDLELLGDFLELLFLIGHRGLLTLPNIGLWREALAIRTYTEPAPGEHPRASRSGMRCGAVDGAANCPRGRPGRNHQTKSEAGKTCRDGWFPVLFGEWSSDLLVWRAN